MHGDSAGRGEDDGDHDTFGSREGSNEDLGHMHGDSAARSGVNPFLTSSGDGIGIVEMDTKSSVEGAAMESFLGDSEQIVVEPSLKKWLLSHLLEKERILLFWELS